MQKVIEDKYHRVTSIANKLQLNKVLCKIIESHPSKFLLKYKLAKVSEAILVKVYQSLKLIILSDVAIELQICFTKEIA